jgi:hypothetical protein
MVDVERWRADPDSSAKEIIAELRSMGDQAQKEIDDESYRGVAKLGFSWMGEDVRPFTGVTQLKQALAELLDGVDSGAVCLVQKRIEAVSCELRLICCRDMAAGPEAMKIELARMRMRPPRHASDKTFALTGHITMTEAEAREVAFKGNAQALEAAEREVWRLGRLWLAYLRDEGFGVPTSCRLDFLVVPPQTADGLPEVWTVELCESGGALCGFTHHARTAAAFNACFREQDEADVPTRPPQPLPALDLDPHPVSAPSTSPPSRGPPVRHRGAVDSRSSASSGGVLARWLGGLHSASKIGAILALVALFFLRLSSRRALKN